MLVAAADPDAERRAAAGARFPRIALFDAVETMLGSVVCDLLVIAAEPRAHAGLVALGLEHGLHVLCEKPLVVTPTDYELVARAHARRPDLGLVAVHQYRYSPAWAAISRCARLAARLRIPFSLTADVQRPGIDPFASSHWRSDVELSGGVLADHGVHYLALAWTVEEQLDVLAGVRTLSTVGECSSATIRLGSGVLTLRVRTGARARRTSVALHVGDTALTWSDRVFAVVLGGRTILRRPVAGLASREHVDSLYERLYRDVRSNLSRPAWRVHRTAEALVVARALLALLERPVEPAAAPSG
jgi:predicted dehydrogenase